MIMSSLDFDYMTSLCFDDSLAAFIGVSWTRPSDYTIAYRMLAVGIFVVDDQGFPSKRLDEESLTCSPCGGCYLLVELLVLLLQAMQHAFRNC